MTEEQQLAILERVPGFSRPSAEWLAGLEVGDRFEFTHYANGKFDTKCLALIHSVCADYVYFTIGHLGDIRVSRSFGFEVGCSYWLWISPIEPEQPQQGKKIQLGDWVASAFGCGLVTSLDSGICTIENQYRLTLKANESECTVLFSPKFRMNDRVIHWHFVGTVKEVWYDNDRDVEAFTYLVHFEGPSETMWCREEDLRPRGDSATIEPEPRSVVCRSATQDCLGFAEL